MPDRRPPGLEPVPDSTELLPIRECTGRIPVRKATGLIPVQDATGLTPVQDATGLPPVQDDGRGNETRIELFVQGAAQLDPLALRRLLAA